MPSRHLLTLGLLGLALALGGCGEKKVETPAAQTPTKLIDQLIRASQLGDTAAIYGLLTSDAQEQDGDVWLRFIGRTASDDMRELFAKIPPDEAKRLKTLPTKEFLETFHTLAPDAFAMLFNFTLSANNSILEEDGQVLIYMTNSRAVPLYLGMARQADGSLKLMGETAAKAVYDKLAKKLNEAMTQAAPQ